MRGLGDLEAEVMDRLWRWRQPTSVRTVLEDLHADARPLAYTTVMTVMENLHRKGFCTREREGRAWMYAPAQSREQYTASVMREVLAASSDRDAALLHFVEEMSPEQLHQLRALVDERAAPARKTRAPQRGPESGRRARTGGGSV